MDARTHHDVARSGVDGPRDGMPTVVYIAGMGRSGSTLLANVLGQADGVVSLGEVRYLWERGLVEDRLCGCGQPTRTCDFWGPVAAATGVADEESAAAWARRLWQHTRIRRLPDLLLRRGASTDTDGLLEQLGRTYVAAAAAAGVDVVVDSSKLPTYAMLLDRVPGVDLRIVHLVRDPRATAASWRREKVQLDNDSMMEQRGITKSALLWNLWNVVVALRWGRRTGRYQLVRYEDFTADPRGVVDDILAIVPGADQRDGPEFVDERTVRLDPQHGVSGNPDRFRTGEVAIRVDDRWRTSLSTDDAAAIRRLTGPVAAWLGDEPDTSAP